MGQENLPPEVKEIIAAAKRQPLTPTLAEHDRQTIHVHAHYEQMDAEGPVTASLGFSQKLPKSDDPPYIRYGAKVRATHEWATLDFGWLNECPGLIILHNLEGLEQRQTIPTELELSQLAQHVIEVRLHRDDLGRLLVHPGCGIPLDVVDPRSIQIRSDPPTRYKLTVFPRAKGAE